MNPLVSCLSLDDAGSDEGEGRAPYTTSYAQDSATKATINESGFSGVFALEYPLVKSVPEVHASSVTKRKIVHPLISPSAQMKPYDHDGRKKSVLYRIPDVDIVEYTTCFKYFVDLPCMRKEDLKLTFQKNHILIEGKRTIEYDNYRSVLFHNRLRGLFHYKLPYNPDVMDIKNATASLEGGVLCIKLSKLFRSVFV